MRDLITITDYFVIARWGRKRLPIEGNGGARSQRRSWAAVAAWVAGFLVYQWGVPTPLAGWQRWVEIVMHRWLHLPFPLGGSAAGASIPSFFAALLLSLALAASPRPREGSAEAPPPATARGRDT